MSNHHTTALAHWRTEERRQMLDCKIFTVEAVRRSAQKRNGEPSSGTFYVLHSPSWVNIIPLTASGNVILIRQYRHGTDDFTLEVPGGLVEQGEDPRAAAERECAEETGFVGEGAAILLGENQPNPAFLDNTCYSYLWRDCRLQAAQNADEHEDIEVVEVPLEEIPTLIQTGVIQHALVLTAFFFLLLREGLPTVLGEERSNGFGGEN
jgi:8-oxo-dGTP pyrophosphatase MutT (NUDIX family)